MASSSAVADIKEIQSIRRNSTPTPTPDKCDHLTGIFCETCTNDKYEEVEPFVHTPENENKDDSGLTRGRGRGTRGRGRGRGRGRARGIASIGGRGFEIEKIESKLENVPMRGRGRARGRGRGRARGHLNYENPITTGNYPQRSFWNFEQIEFQLIEKEDKTFEWVRTITHETDNAHLTAGFAFNVTTVKNASVFDSSGWSTVAQKCKDIAKIIETTAIHFNPDMLMTPNNCPTITQKFAELFPRANVQFWKPIKKPLSGEKKSNLDPGHGLDGVTDEEDDTHESDEGTESEHDENEDGEIDIGSKYDEKTSRLFDRMCMWNIYQTYNYPKYAALERLPRAPIDPTIPFIVNLKLIYKKGTAFPFKPSKGGNPPF